MLRHVAHDVYPVDDNDTLEQAALQMPNASMHDGAVYHFDRYGPDGLFRGFDPADDPLYEGGESLKETYPALQSIRHALVVAATINQEKYL